MRESPWRRPAKPERPTKVPLSQAQIVEAALRIVKTEGVDGVSMRRIAAEFDTGPSSLYAHVTSKDELLQLMFEEVCGLVEVPPFDAARWQEQVREIARNGHRALADHYDLARTALGTVPSGPNAMRISEAMLTLMLAGGVPSRVAAWAMDRIFLYITADAYEMSIWRGEATTPTDILELGEDLVAYFEQLPEDTYPNLRRHARDMIGGGTDERFELGLDLLVGGLDKFVRK
ncbi:TetR/AcrR family transcriptional regulator [Paractinoplanes toevensis]|uniref:Transcriptional regulator n=1 Tax=Paractinoplanes toevensis TaxID=571911 RepID=A0A919WCI3_9ACTN|nr:TetR/AcrR family transcriptional regulator [Actinoplanes toevensis]GIM97734.1 transcriptional regulator [Actinoplanes toevensis]